MADGGGSRPISQDQGPDPPALGSPRQGEGLRAFRDPAPRLALPPRRSKRGLLATGRPRCATFSLVIRALCREGGGKMKRAQRHAIGSVRFDKRRKTWNYLWY